VLSPGTLNCGDGTGEAFAELLVLLLIMMV
jgi:hypothetical protein